VVDETARAFPAPRELPTVIGVRGARQNNLKDVDIDVPLWRVVAVVGVSGSGKTSLAIGTLYAEGLQRLLEGLSTYSRRRLTQARRPDVDRVEHLPPALALRQRPSIPGPRSTVGTMSEVLNVLRLMMSRLGSHLCPNGHRVGPSVAAADYVIDMGPGGGPDGGQILAVGTPDAVARSPVSVTGSWLAAYLGMPGDPSHTQVPAEELQG
jgi:excinuclease UvrABC ATPase subunit